MYDYEITINSFYNVGLLFYESWGRKEGWKQDQNNMIIASKEKMLKENIENRIVGGLFTPYFFYCNVPIFFFSEHVLFKVSYNCGRGDGGGNPVPLKTPNGFISQILQWPKKP